MSMNQDNTLVASLEEIWIFVRWPYTYVYIFVLLPFSVAIVILIQF